MEILLAGAGMVACMALMMVVVPLGRKVIGRVRGGSDAERGESTASIRRLSEDE